MKSPVARWIALVLAAAGAAGAIHALTGARVRATAAPPPLPSGPPPLRYEVLRDDTRETRSAAGRSLDILVPGPDLAAEQLRALLLHVHALASRHDGFRNHDRPSHVFIHAYRTPEDAAPGVERWVARLTREPDDAQPRISVAEAALQAPGPEDAAPPALDEEARRAVFEELIQAQVVARNEAEAAHPDLDPFSYGYTPERVSRQTRKREGLARLLERRARAEIAARHALTRQQLEAIEGEARSAGWRSGPATGRTPGTPGSLP